LPSSPRRFLSLSPALSALLTPLGAFLGAAATIAAVYFLGRRDGQIDSTTLLLGGVITGSFLSAIITFSWALSLPGTPAGMGSGYWAIFPLLIKRASIGFWVLASSPRWAIYTTASDLNLLLAVKKKPCISAWMSLASASWCTSPHHS